MISLARGSIARGPFAFGLTMLFVEGVLAGPFLFGPGGAGGALMIGVFVAVLIVPVFAAAAIVTAFSARVIRIPRPAWDVAIWGSAGSLAMIFLWLPFSYGFSDTSPEPAKLTEVVVGGAASALVGAVYWLFAGRPRPAA